MQGRGAIAATLALAVWAAPARGDVSAEVAARLTPAQLAGQRVVFAFAGTRPPPALVRRIRGGRVAGVILFAGNLAGPGGPAGVTRRLRAVPRPPGVPPLLVMVDQEGGQVRRLGGPPARSAGAQAAAGPRATRGAGRRAGLLLRRVGIDVDLAPVADVARPGSFLARQGRSYGAAPTRVSRLVVAFAAGLRSAGVAATAKHFPGLGAARRSTDDGPVAIATPTAILRRVDMRPYRALVRHRVDLVMLATARYTALGLAPAALSRRIAVDELRTRLGFRGVSITDALDTPALAAEGGGAEVAVRAARAGADLLLYASYDGADRAARALATAIGRGRLAPGREAVARVLSLRRRLARARALPRPPTARVRTPRTRR